MVAKNHITRQRKGISTLFSRWWHFVLSLPSVHCVHALQDICTADKTLTSRLKDGPAALTRARGLQILEPLQHQLIVNPIMARCPRSHHANDYVCNQEVGYTITIPLAHTYARTSVHRSLVLDLPLSCPHLCTCMFLHSWQKDLFDEVVEIRLQRDDRSVGVKQMADRSTN